MKLRSGFLFLACAALVAAGCGGDDKDGDSGSSEKKEKPTKQQAAAQEDRENKEKSVAEAKKAVAKDEGDVGACRNLAMSYIALASPASTPDPKDMVQPEDRDKSLKQAQSTLEDCVKIDGKDRDVQQMLASTYMATNKYDKASPLLEKLAKSAKGDERANAYYAWGLAASNAQELDDAISAWQQFVELSPAKDPRVAQVKQSIKALQAAKKQPAPATTPAAAESDADKDAEN